MSNIKKLQFISSASPQQQGSLHKELGVRRSRPSPLWIQSLSPVKPVIVSGLITDAQSSTLSLGLDNRASVLSWDDQGTSDMSLPNCPSEISVSEWHSSLLFPAAWKDYVRIWERHTAVFEENVAPLNTAFTTAEACAEPWPLRTLQDRNA